MILYRETASDEFDMNKNLNLIYRKGGNTQKSFCKQRFIK